MTNVASSAASVVNDNLQNAVAVLINKTISGVDKSVDFLSEQLPDVIHQLIVWNIVESICWALVNISVTLILVKLVYIFCNLVKKNNESDYYIPAFLIGAITLVPLVISVYYITNALKIWIAPKVWLIEYAASLVK